MLALAGAAATASAVARASATMAAWVRRDRGRCRIWIPPFIDGAESKSGELRRSADELQPSHPGGAEVNSTKRLLPQPGGFEGVAFVVDLASGADQPAGGRAEVV